MKKLLNSILAIFLLCSCTMIAISHIANKFFQEDIGNVVMEEVDIRGQISTLFDQSSVFLNEADKEKVQTLKENVLNNKEVNRLIGEATQGMLEDIVEDSKENQDMKSLLKEVMRSYDDELQSVVGNEVSTQAMYAYVDGVIDVLPVQLVYDSAVTSFKQEIPQPYMKMLKVLSVIAKEGVQVACAIISIILSGVLIILNRKQLTFFYSIGMATLGSGIVLLVLGKLVPVLYQNLLQRLDQTLAGLSTIDFKILTMYGIGFSVFGVSCLVLHFIVKRKRL